MLKRTLLLLAMASAVVIALPDKAAASKTIVGRITNYSTTSLSVRDKEVLTVTLDGRTTYTKLITQKPWQEDVQLGIARLRVGQFVTVHVRQDSPSVADWVQIATDMRPAAFAVAPSTALAAATPDLSSETSTSSDLLTSRQVRKLIAEAKTAEDHVKLQHHFLALAAKYDASARDHAADAQAYRKTPSFRDSKSPVGPGTAAHCDRFAELDREAAKEARDLAVAHEHMAAAK
jgi:hypothetical protein